MNPALPCNTPLRTSILVVDDDEGMRESICDMLSSKYRVTLAIDGLDGYVKAHEQPQPDLIIADVAMPRLDGITMVRRLRENHELRHVPIIFLTGQMSLAKLIAVPSVGSFAYLPKPTDADVLEKKVEEALIGA
jgi:CheY-like chemotaxis protein